LTADPLLMDASSEANAPTKLQLNASRTGSV
jgi:hypothetical protein